MFIATYIYPNSENEIFMGKVSIFNYLAVALTSFRNPFVRRWLVIKPFKFAEKHFCGVQCFPKKYKFYPYLNADPRHASVHWVSIWKLRPYLETKEYIADWAIDRRF